MIWNPDCDENPCLCPGEERAAEAPAPPEAPAPTKPWTLTRALANAWTWGYAAAKRDMLARPYSGTPEAQEWEPTANPYAVNFGCTDHKLVQHRDLKPAWCHACGRAADGEPMRDPRPATNH